MAELVEQVSELNLEKELEDMAHGVASNDVVAEELEDASKAVRHEMIAVFKQWLVRKSSCPVAFSWHDLGEYFWPRWIKTGSCTSTEVSAEAPSGGVKGCSWPRGMRCVQGEVKALHILRWHCRRKKKRAYGARGHREARKQHRCQWYKGPYPVTQSCKCSCQD